MKEYKEIKKLENGNIIYFRFSIPLMNDRDCYMKVTKRQIDKNSIYYQAYSVENHDKPPPQVVRMFYSINGVATINKDSPHDTIDYTEISYRDLNFDKKI